LPRHRAVFSLAFACAAALALAGAGCSNTAQVIENKSEGGWFSKALDFSTPDWARPSNTSKGINLGPLGPAGPEDMVGADGRCAPMAVAQAAEPPPASAAPTPPADRPVGSVAGDLAGPPMAAAVIPDPGLQSLEPATPQVLGGIALGMTECQTVQRAGQPSNVAISADEKGERKAVLTFLSGPWPGIYTFTSGRLKVIDRAPEQPKPAKTSAKKTPKKKR
jgi:hypothetical protein